MVQLKVYLVMVAVLILIASVCVQAAPTSTESPAGKTQGRSGNFFMGGGYPSEAGYLGGTAYPGGGAAYPGSAGYLGGAVYPGSATYPGSAGYGGGAVYPGVAGYPGGNAYPGSAVYPVNPGNSYLYPGYPCQPYLNQAGYYQCGYPYGYPYTNSNPYSSFQTPSYGNNVYSGMNPNIGNRYSPYTGYGRSGSGDDVVGGDTKKKTDTKVDKKDNKTR